MKPAFFDDEDLAAVSHSARLLFVALWQLADCEGRLEDRPLRIRAYAFPYEAAVDVESLLAELARLKVHGNGACITRYEVDGRKLLQVNTLGKHQNFHPNEKPAGFPAPPQGSSAFYRPLVKSSEQQPASTAVPSGPSDTDTTPPLPPSLARGGEQSGCATPAVGSGRSAARKLTEAVEDARARVIALGGHPERRDERRWRHALRAGYTVDELVAPYVREGEQRAAADRAVVREKRRRELMLDHPRATDEALEAYHVRLRKLLDSEEAAP